jgi:hypothetical protein
MGRSELALLNPAPIVAIHRAQNFIGKKESINTPPALTRRVGRIFDLLVAGFLTLRNAPSLGRWERRMRPLDDQFNAAFIHHPQYVARILRIEMV